MSQASQQTPDGNYRILDKSWESIQEKTFSNWISTKLTVRGIAPIRHLATDLSSGETLIQLLEIIGDESLGKYNKAPKLRLQKIENMNKALEFIKKRGVNLTNIGAEDIVDSNSKLILGLIWTIILRFSIADISEEGLSAKEGLLLWCQRKTQPYCADFQIKDFTFSWNSGLALCALIHRHRPDLFDYWGLDKSAKRDNTALAMDVAAKYLNIPKLFEPEDLVDVPKPDERSVMTYVAQYFHAFSGMDKMDTAGRRIGQFGTVMQAAWEMQNDYERRVRSFMAGICETRETWDHSSSWSGYGEAKQQLTEFDSYKRTSKRGWVAEKRDLDALLGNIQTKLKTYNLATYVPPTGLGLHDIESAWTHLIQVEGERKQKLTSFIRDIKETLKKKFATSANRFQADLENISSTLASLEGELEAQLETVSHLISRLNPLKAALSDIEAINAECVEANIEDNEYTIYDASDLEFDFGLVSQSLNKKSSFIQNQIVARTMSNVSPQQLEEYSETFRHFDKDNSNTLSRHEFKAALQVQGYSYDEAEFDKIFNQVSHGDDNVSFEEYINFVRSVEEDKTTPEQLKLSFKTLAGEKSYITEQNMVVGGLSPTVIEMFKATIPKKEGVEGYDYAAYLRNVFAA
jgi:Ca2+-binding EF-hand superfamily protein